MELFTPIVPLDKQHPNFRLLSLPRYGREAERKLLRGWGDGFVDRDGKFVKEFQTTFNSSFWERYLHTAFRELGFTPDFRYARPDFVLSGPQDIAAEATIASHPDGHVPEWEREYTEEALANADPSAILELATVRLASAIHTKQRKYLEDYSRLEHVKNKPFVLCIAPFEQPFFFFQGDQAIRRVLYGYDQPVWVEHPKIGERTIIGESMMDRIEKNASADIDLGVFTRQSLEHVSAVIFSTVATSGRTRALVKESSVHERVLFQAFRFAADAQHHRVIVAQRPLYEETLLDGLHVLLNPFARHPLDPSPFERPDVAIHRFEPDGLRYHVDLHDGFLFYRQVTSLVATDDLVTPDVGKMGSQNYRTFQPTPWPEGELRRVSGHVGLASENVMCHYRGWTLAIYHDPIDEDWGGQAIGVLCKTLAEFARLNSNEETATVFLSGFFATKEEAVEQLKHQVDEQLG